MGAGPVVDSHEIKPREILAKMDDFWGVPPLDFRKPNIRMTLFRKMFREQSLDKGGKSPDEVDISVIELVVALCLKMIHPPNRPVEFQTMTTVALLVFSHP